MSTVIRAFTVLLLSNYFNRNEKRVYLYIILITLVAVVIIIIKKEVRFAFSFVKIRQLITVRASFFASSVCTLCGIEAINKFSAPITTSVSTENGIGQNFNRKNVSWLNGRATTILGIIKIYLDPFQMLFLALS